MPPGPFPEIKNNRLVSVLDLARFCPVLALISLLFSCVSSSETQGQSVGSGESFQVRAKEALGTDSHRTICKNSSRSRVLIGHKKCFVLLCPIGGQFLLSSFREFVHECYCPVRSPSLCEQGKLLFPTFLTRNEGTTDESKKRLQSAGAINLPREYCVFDSSQCIVNNSKLKMRRRRKVK